MCAQNFNWIGKTLDGNSVQLYRFKGEFHKGLPGNSTDIRRGLVLDLETTGLDKKNDKIIEIGLRPFDFNRASGAIVEIYPGISQLEDPGFEISAELTRLTGITPQMLKNQKIDWSAVDEAIQAANLIIAHNAFFDRPFLERYSQASKSKTWACSLKQVQWAQKGYPSSKLELLAIYHGFFSDAHRALEDADTLLHLLSHTDVTTKNPYLLELLETARKPLAKVVASNARFETKDLLKERGYGWDAKQKVWQKYIFKEALEEEKAWLSSAVYQGSFQGQVSEIALVDNFKS